MEKPVTTQPPKRSSRHWIAYLVIALILALWSILGAAFFLLVVWIALQNPPADMISAVGKTEKSTARRVYTWLFVSSLFTVPFFIILVASSYSRNTTNNQHVLHAIIPLLFHLPLLLGLTSRSRFVYRHTQQGILLIALRTGLAALAVSMGSYPEDGLWLFLFGNGSLWLFGSIWGWVQINRGKYSWMKEKDGLVAAGPESALPKIDPLTQLSPEKYLEYSKFYLRRQLKNSSKEYALEAFRRGDVDVKRQAVRVLDELNEVEYF